jgi:NitT/TauT family transport system permease protein
VILPFVPILLVAIIWQVQAEQAQSLVLPTFTEFAAALVDLLGDPAFWDALLLSNQALVVGYVLAVLIGVPFGLAMGRVARIRNVVDPYVNLFLVVPMAVLLPIILIALGISFTARTAVIFVFAVPFVVVPCLAGVRVIDRQLLDMSRTYGSNEYELWRYVLIPGALPAILSGLRQGLAHALSGMVVVELTMMAVGVGRLIQLYGSNFEYDYIFAVVFAVVLESVIGVSILRAFERRAERVRRPLGSVA